jgi:rhodanese-related sulfurtransferase
VAIVAGEEGPVADADALANIEAGAQEIKERVEAGEPVVLLDVREPEETALGVIPGARRIPLGQLEARWAEVRDCNEIVCYCAHGQRSVAAAELLRKHGLFNATSLEGGVAAWQGLGGKLVPA